MKVSIITYHDEDNYGATLQAYATYKAVESLGFKPEIVNLHMVHKVGFPTKVLFGIKRLRFNKFREKYMPNKTRLYTDVDDLRKYPPESDVYLVGSDQTWNPTISKRHAKAYFLDFGKMNQKRISYASSFGNDKWIETPYITKTEADTFLKRFSTLLVREDKAVEILKNEFGLSSAQVLDPVLLFPSYSELTGKIEDSGKLIIYKIVNDPLFYRKAVDLGILLGIKVQSIGSMRQIKGVISKYPERIEKWIANIASAQYVFTDSFHGTVLSIIYHRQFAVYVGDKGKMSRLYSLLKLVGLEDRVFSANDNPQTIVNMLQKPINYERVDVILNEERSKSLSLLEKAICVDD